MNVSSSKRPEISDLIASTHLTLVKVDILKIDKGALGSGMTSDKLILLLDSCLSLSDLIHEQHSNILDMIMDLQTFNTCQQRKLKFCLQKTLNQKSKSILQVGGVLMFEFISCERVERSSFLYELVGPLGPPVFSTIVLSLLLEEVSSLSFIAPEIGGLGLQMGDAKSSSKPAPITIKVLLVLGT